MDNLQLILTTIVKGFRDAICGVYTLYQLSKAQADKRKGKDRKRKNVNDEDASITYRICQCCALNGFVFWFSIIIFNKIIYPGLQMVIVFIVGTERAEFIWSWAGPVFSIFFDTIWVLPLFCLSKIVNSLWFQDIAESAYRHGGWRHQYIQGGISKAVADFLFSIFVQTLFLVQSMMFNLLPIPPVGQLVSLFHMCLLYSLYAFEYKWFNMGWEMHKRLSFIENNWPYFTGFGLPLAILTVYESSFVISGCIFSILFPLLIISANKAVPIIGVCDFPLRLFSPVIWLSNAILQKTMVTKRVSNVKAQSSSALHPKRS